ncbi:MAG: S24/S26 family peptidase [Clostridia bacterium]|nr:S24/S26 family peptidase [Clostridia bacterium]
MNNIENELKEKGIYIGKTQGDSMQPMLKEGRDTVIIVPPVFPLKKYDVPVYRRGGHYTMHRIVKATKRGYVICGDNRTHLEKDITKSKMSPASIGGGFHLLFSVGVQSPTETLNDGALPLIERTRILSAF